ncbi:MAG TPA: DNA translocase FtsK 4TM domain-containing protein, partial [Bacillota bacterium]|nr:DNA translocase FtsK 4TM domain-containing protein [Bacillota bacterium]
MAVRKARRAEEEAKRRPQAEEVLGGQLGLEAMGIVCLAGALLVFVFLVLQEAGSAQSGSVGILGAKFAGWLKGLLGVTVYILPAALGYAGLLMLVRKKGYFGSARMMALAGLVASASALAAVFGDEFGMYGGQGGAMGSFLARIMTGLIGRIGTGIVFSAAGLLALVVLSNIPVSTAAAFLFAMLWYMALSAGRLIAAGYRAL